MLDYALYAVSLAIILVALAMYFRPMSTPRTTTVPGLKPSDLVTGNLAEVADAGGFHQFLTKLHAEYGDIASFHFKDQLCVSIASPQLFMEHQSVFDRPLLLFEMAEYLITSDSIQLTNGAEGRRRRDLTDRCFGFQAIENCEDIFNELGEEMVTKLSSFPADEHIPLRPIGLEITLKGILRTSFGDFFSSDKSLASFREDYYTVWKDMEDRFEGNIPEPGSQRQKEAEKARDRINAIVKEVITLRRANPPSEGKEIFIDVLLKSGYTENALYADALTYVIGGFHTTGNTFAWAIYYLAKNDSVQEQLFNEVMGVAGRTGQVTMKHLSTMNYLRQVISETLRCSVIAPFSARVQDIDVILGGHVIRKGTPVVHALGVVLESDVIFPNPEVFDPERFSPPNVKNRHRHAFHPFGFAGERVCPGQQFAYKEISFFLTWFIRAFKVKLVPGQVFEHVYGLAGRLTNKDGGDVWVTVEKR